MKLSPDVDLAEIARACENFTGADFKALLYNSQLEVIHELTDRRTLSTPHSPNLQNGWHLVKSDDKTAQTIPESPSVNSLTAKEMNFEVTPREVPCENRSSSEHFQVVTGESLSVKDLGSTSSASNSSPELETLSVSSPDVTTSQVKMPSPLPDDQSSYSDTDLLKVDVDKVALPVISTISSNNIVFIPKLEEGVVEVSLEKEQQILKEVRML